MSLSQCVFAHPKLQTATHTRVKSAPPRRLALTCSVRSPGARHRCRPYPTTVTWNKDWAHDTGPLLAYLARCPSDNCDEVDVNKLQWFKIAEEGLVSGSVESGLWANKKMMDNNFEWTAKIPASIPDGAYMLRTETIALHDVGKAQNYPQCAHVDIKGGSGVEVPAEYLVTFPGGYKYVLNCLVEV